MAAQATPTYTLATGKPEEPIVKELVYKYGFSNIAWPIVLSQGERTLAYVYEKNKRNDINSESDLRPESNLGLTSFFIDYTSEPRRVLPSTDFFTDFIDPKYNCSYDYILNSPYETVDLDYVWYTGRIFKGFELTTFYVNFDSHDLARNLISKMNRRPSWQGPNGAQALRKIIDSAFDLRIDYYLVCVNTISKVGSDIKTNGNVCLFRLNHEQINRLERGLPPTETEFLSFAEFLEWL